MGILEQAASKNFPSTAGRITHSELTSQHGSHGASYDVKLEYEYEVDGRSYKGTRYRCIRTGSLEAMRQVVDAHPVGSSAPVYYNPKDPQDSLLSPGMERSDWMALLLLTPFNLVMLGLWFYVGWQWRKLAPPPAPAQ